MQRPTVADALASRLPETIGKCSTDVAGVCSYINAATQRLMYAREVGDTGWWGSWMELAIEFTDGDPFFTAPREVARVINMDVCTYPILIQNQFFEYLKWGAGRFPKSSCTNGRCAGPQAYDRGTFPTFKDVIGSDKKLRFYLTDPADELKRVLVQYKDANGVPVRSLDGTVQVDGEFLSLVPPFVDTTSIVSKVTGIIKDVTLGRVTIYEVDTVTAEQRLIGFMEPGETVAAYRRYYVGSLPRTCCNPPSTSTTVQATAMCKLDYVPVSVVTDYLQIPNIEALIHECQSVRYGGIDEVSAKGMSADAHRSAIRLLQGQLVANEGTQQPAIGFFPFGSARLACQRIGMNI